MEGYGRMSTAEAKAFDLAEANLENPTVLVSAINTPSDYYDEGMAFKSPHIKQQVDAVKRSLSLAATKGANIVILPESSVPDQMRLEIRTWCVQANAFVVGGFEIGTKRRNFAFVCTPRGLLYEIPKVNPSRWEEGIWKKQSPIAYSFTNTGFGDFGVLTCYDATDSHMINALHGRIDLLFVPASDPSSRTFDATKLSVYSHYSQWVVCR